MFEFLRLLKKWFSTEKFQFSFAIDQITLQQNKNSYSFKMGYGGAGLDALLLGDPLELEGWEGGQDGATDPSRVLSFWWSDDLDLRVVGGSGGDLFLHSLSKAGEQGGTS